MKKPRRGLTPDQIRVSVAVKIFGSGTDDICIHPCPRAFRLTVFDGADDFLVTGDNDRAVVAAGSLVSGE